MLKRFINFAIKIFASLFPSEKPLLLTGKDSALKLASLLRLSGYRRPLLVTEKSLLELGLLDGVLGQLKNEGCDVSLFDGVVPNPTCDVVEVGISACKANDCDSVFVVGGGSAIDVAKVIAACRAMNVGVHAVVGLLKVKQPTLPLYVVPTTSGTGSEVTSTAVISDTKTHEKNFVVDPKLIPSVVALDPELIKSLPSHITAATGMDALTHAIEAYTSLNRFSDAERDAELAIQLLIKYLPVVCEDGNNIKAREWVAIASFLAGYAFNKSGLGYVHAISHQISALYNTPHGIANAVILTRVLRFNQGVCAHRLAKLETMLDDDAKGSEDSLANRFVERVELFAKRLDIPSELAELETKHFDEITTNALKEARWSYAIPRNMSRAQCKEILSSIAAAA